MKSIRQQLTLGLLLGCTVLLGAGGAVIFFSTRTALYEEFDDALLSRALSLAGVVHQERNKLEIELKEKVGPGWTAPRMAEFYQFWLVGGATLRKSQSLGTHDLPCEAGSAEAPRYFDLELPHGLKGRAVGLRFTPHMGDKVQKQANSVPPSAEVALVVAEDRSRLDQSLSSLGSIVLGAGGITILATLGLLAIVLRRCLAPLDRVAELAHKIDAGSLGTRFPSQGMPSELSPICDRLNDLLARLERSFGDVSEYAAKVSHELRTPLAILRLKIEQAGDRLDPELGEELEAEIQQLAHLVEQSLLIAKADQGRLVVQPRPFDLAEMVADVAQDFSLLAQEQGRNVRFTGGSHCDVTADPKYARQITHNLLSNALKHGQGDIHVKLGDHPAGHCLTILNRVRRPASPSDETLGLGLRVVDTLLHLHPGMKYGRRQGRRYYAVRVTFPATPPISLGQPFAAAIGRTVAHSYSGPE